MTADMLTFEERPKVTDSAVQEVLRHRMPGWESKYVLELGITEVFEFDLAHLGRPDVALRAEVRVVRKSARA